MFAHARHTACLLLFVGVIFAGCEGGPRIVDPTPLPPPPPPPPPAPLTVATILPTAGFVGYPQRLMVTGTGFKAGLTLTLGGIPASNLIVSTAVISADPPVLGVGTVDVTVTNPDGESVTLPAGFAVHRVTLSVEPAVVSPGDTIRVSWDAPGRAGKPLDWIALWFLDIGPTFIEDRYAYTGGKSSGTLSFIAPATLGRYEFQYLLDDDFYVVAQVPVSVR